MKMFMSLVPIFLMMASTSTFCQDLEIQGSAKITEMNVVNNPDSVVVKMSDGTLAVSHVDSLVDPQMLSISNDTIRLSNGGYVKQALPVEDTMGNRMRICCGSSPTDGSGWVDAGGSPYIYIDVNTSSCNFSSTPTYFSSLGGNGGHYAVLGSNAIYSPTSTGFRIYLTKHDLTAPAIATASSSNWHIKWCAYGN